MHLRERSSGLPPAHRRADDIDEDGFAAHLTIIVPALGDGAGGKLGEVSTPTIPDNLLDLLERPLYGSLGVIRPDGTVQVSPMWFELIDGTLRFTHTNTRAKFRALQQNPSMSLAVFDPETPIHHVEVRGRLIEAQPDPTGAFYQRLGRRYGNPETPAPPDAAERVVLVMSIDRVLGR